MALRFHSQLDKCVRSASIYPQLQRNLHHIAASLTTNLQAEALHFATLRCNIVERSAWRVLTTGRGSQCGALWWRVMVTNAVHWFRNWSLIMGRGGGSTHCLYGFVHLHKLFMELEKGLDCQHTNSIMIQNTLNLMPCIPSLANPLANCSPFDKGGTFQDCICVCSSYSTK